MKNNRPLTKNFENLRKKLRSFSKLTPLNTSKNSSNSSVINCRNMKNSFNNTLSHQVSTNILNVFSTSMDSNTSQSSQVSQATRKESKKKLRVLNYSKEINNTEEDLLDKIEIKEVYDCIPPKITQLPQPTLKKTPTKKNNKILINISTNFIKGTNNYHKKKASDSLKSTKTSANKNSSFDNDNNEIKTYQKNEIELKKKIISLLEMNSKLTNEKTELITKNKELEGTIKKLKKYIFENKIQDVQFLRNENERLKKDLQKAAAAAAAETQKSSNLLLLPDRFSFKEKESGDGNTEETLRHTGKLISFKQNSITIDPENI